MMEIWRQIQSLSLILKTNTLRDRNIPLDKYQVKSGSSKKRQNETDVNKMQGNRETVP